MMKNNKKTVIFDLDGTLVDTVQDIKAALDASMESFNIRPLGIRTVKSLVGRGSRELIQKTFESAKHSPTDKQIKEALGKFLKYYESNINVYSKPFPGIIKCLKWLHSQEIHTGICSNKSERLVRKLISELKLTTYFTAITGGDTLSVRKPNPMHLLYTIKLAGGIPRKALMIGDSGTDVQAAKNANIPIIVVGWGYPEVTPAALGGDGLVKTENQLIPAIKGMLFDKIAKN